MSISLLSPFLQAESEQLGVKDTRFQSCIDDIARKKGWVTPQEFKEIVCHNKKIESVEGLSKFSSITKLSLYRNRITELDVSSLTGLEHLNIAGNLLTTFRLDEMPKLSQFYAFHNKLRRIEVSNCTGLKTMKVNNNEIITSMLVNLPNLSKLYLFDNKMESLALTGMEKLHYLDVRNNPMPDDFYDYLDTINGLTSLHDGNAEDWN